MENLNYSSNRTHNNDMMDKIFVVNSGNIHHNRPDRFDDDAFKGFRMHFSDTEVNFLVYLGWKTLGWAMVFLGVLLVIRFLKIWLIHAWIRETTSSGMAGTGRWDPELGVCSRSVEASAAAAVMATRASRRPRSSSTPSMATRSMRSSRRSQQRYTNRLLRLQQQQQLLQQRLQVDSNGDDPQLDLPPEYDEVAGLTAVNEVGNTKPSVRSSNVEAEEELPPSYDSLFCEVTEVIEDRQQDKEEQNNSK